MRIVIVGAGLGGVAAAVGLVGAGHDVVLCERTDQVREAGTGVVVMPNGVLALDALGVSRWIRSQAEQPLFGGIRDHRGRRLLVTGGAQAERAQRALGAPTVMVGRPALHRALRAPLTAGVLRTGMAVQRLHQDGGAVHVVCDTTTLTADAAVVADGIRSTLRPQLFPDHPGLRRAGRLALRAMGLAPDRPRLDGAGLLVDHRTGSSFGRFPSGDGMVYWFTDTALDGEPPKPADARRQVLAEMADWHPAVPALIAATPPGAIHVDPTTCLAEPLESFAVGRVALLGDAAHAMTPDLGQGANQAFEDAMVLTRHLADADSGAVVDRLLRYDAERRPRANRLLVQSSRMSRTMTLTGVRARLRNLGLRAVPDRLAAAALYRTMRIDVPGVPL